MNVISYSDSVCCCRVLYHHECDVLRNHTPTVYDAFTYCITANAIMQYMNLILTCELEFTLLLIWSVVGL